MKHDTVIRNVCADSQHVDSESSREAGKTPTHHSQGEFGDMLDTSILLPINKPSIAAFQSLIDTFANARDLRFACVCTEDFCVYPTNLPTWLQPASLVCFNRMVGVYLQAGVPHGVAASAGAPQSAGCRGIPDSTDNDSQHGGRVP